MDRQIALITGGTDGIGKTTATELARKGFTVVLAARNKEKAASVASEIVSVTGNRNVDHITVDLGSLSQVYQLAQMFTARYGRLDVLINNAGILMPQRVITEDGFERTFQVNYLAPFYLTQLLAEALKDSPQGRLVNLTSSVYRIARFDPNNLQGERRFSTLGSYASSKLMVLLFTLELAERMKSTAMTVNAVHPGVVRTPMMLNAKGLFKVMSLVATPIATSPEQGAATSVFVATAPELAETSGQYFTNSRAKKVTSSANTAENRILLWQLSVEACQRTLL
ncbi:MAG: SDR family oxidoreductase [Mycobacterium sp.]